MQFDISAMEKKHTFDIAEIEKVCFSRPWSQKSIENELENESAYFYVAIENGNVAGYCGTHIVLDECYIANIAVLPKYRGNGLGKLLTEHLINTAKKNDCAFITLEVRPSNTVAVKMYEKLGFKVLGKRKNFYSSPIEDGLIMTLYFTNK